MDLGAVSLVRSRGIRPGIKKPGDKRTVLTGEKTPADMLGSCDPPRLQCRSLVRPATRRGAVRNSLKHRIDHG